MKVWRGCKSSTSTTNK